MMQDERCENRDGPKVPFERQLNYRCILPSADCWSRSGVTLLTLLSFYAHTKNEYITLRTGNAQNRAKMDSVNSVYTPRGIGSGSRINQR